MLSEALLCNEVNRLQIWAKGGRGRGRACVQELTTDCVHVRVRPWEECNGWGKLVGHTGSQDFQQVLPHITSVYAFFVAASLQLSSSQVTDEMEC